jgi:hypothetical protein
MFGADAAYMQSRLLFIRGAMNRNIGYFSANRERVIQSFNRYTEEYYIMAAKLKTKIASKSPTRQEFVWQGFVNVNLTVEQKEEYRAWDVEDSEVWDGIATYCAAGYKVALSFNKQNDKFSCTGTGQPETGDNSGYAVSAFANTPYEAARVWLFKVSVVLPERWKDHAADAPDDIG